MYTQENNYKHEPLSHREGHTGHADSPDVPIYRNSRDAQSTGSAVQSGFDRQNTS